MEKEFCECFTIDYEDIVNNREEITEEIKQQLVIMVEKTNEATGNKGQEYKQTYINVTNINVCKGRSKVSHSALSSSWLLCMYNGEPIIVEFTDSSILGILNSIVGKELEFHPVDGQIISFHYARNVKDFKCPDDISNPFDFKDIEFI